MKQVWLNGNHLRGNLPEAARDSFTLSMLCLEDNNFQGKVPLSWTEFSRLSVRIDVHVHVPCM